MAAAASFYVFPVRFGRIFFISFFVRFFNVSFKHCFLTFYFLTFFFIIQEATDEYQTGEGAI